MESSEASASNSRQSPASFESNPTRRRGVTVGALISPARKAYYRQQAYAPAMRKPIRPYHPSTQPRVDKATETMRYVVKEKIHTLENKLAECQKELNLVTTENKTYKMMLRRQETTLKQYEGSETSLPQVIQAHDEEMRVIKSTLQAEKRMVRELEHQLKLRDDQLMPLRGECDKLEKLCKGSKLDEREQLTAEVERLKERLKEKEEKILVLTRRVMLEAKNSRHELGVVEQKLREAQRDLADKRDECERLRQVLAEKHKFIADNARRFAGNRTYTYVYDTDKKTASCSATSLNGTSFPGLNAQMRNDPNNLWPAKENSETDSRCSTVTVLSTTPTHSSTSTLPNLHKTLTIRQPKKTISDCRIVALPHISIKQLAVKSEEPREEVQANKSARSETTLSKESALVSNEGSEEKEDSLDDELLLAELRRKKVSSENKRISGLCGLLITVRTGSPSNSILDNSRNQIHRVVTMVESPELLKSQLAATEKGYLQLTRESLPSSEELYDGFGLVDDTDDNYDDESSNENGSDTSDASEEVHVSKSTKELTRGERPAWHDQAESREERVKPKRKSRMTSPESLVEIEENVKKEKEKSLELKAKYDKLEKALKKSNDDEDDPRIDVEQRAKLLAALKKIDSATVERLPGDDLSPGGQGKKRDATIFTASTFVVPRLALPSHRGSSSSTSTTPSTSHTFPTPGSSAASFPPPSSSSATSGSTICGPRFPVPNSAAPSLTTSGSVIYGPASSISCVFPRFAAPSSATSPSVAPGSASSSSASSNSATPSLVAPDPRASSPSTSGNSRLPASRRVHSKRVSSSPVAHVPKAWIPVSSDPVSSAVTSPPVASNHVAPSSMGSSVAPSPAPRGNNVDPGGQKLLIDLFGSRAVEKKPLNAEDKLLLNDRKINDRNNNNVPTTSNRL